MVKSSNKQQWSLKLMRVYQKWPAAFKSSDWPEIKRLVANDDVAGAEALARSHEKGSKVVRAENVIARRIRIQRVQLWKIQAEYVNEIKAHFEAAGQAIGHRMIHLPNTVSSIAPMRKAVRGVIVELRRNVLASITDLIWESIILGVKNMGEAIKPILRDNRESFTEELADVALIEERLTIGIDRSLAGKAKAHVQLGSDKWQAILDKIYTDIVKSNLSGMTLSERVWDMTNRAEMDIRRILSSEIAKGTPSREIADRINKYVFTNGVDEYAPAGPGVYKSPLKNAMRVARTETNRAYTKATAAWAGNKPWVKGIMPTLSAAHDKEDDCDDVVANAPDEGYSPAEFADIVPVHPHCMCFGTYVIDENYLVGDNSDSADDDEEAA